MAGISNLLSSMLTEFEDIHLKQPGAPVAGYPGEGIIPYSEDWSFTPVCSPLLPVIVPSFDISQIRPPLTRKSTSSSGVPTHLHKAHGLPLNTVHAADTRRVIEAIFNPYPSSSVAPNPFTYYVPPSPTTPKAPERAPLTTASSDSPVLTLHRQTTQEQLFEAARYHRAHSSEFVLDSSSLRSQTPSLESEHQQEIAERVTATPEPVKPTGWLKRLFSSNGSASSTSEASSPSTPKATLGTSHRTKSSTSISKLRKRMVSGEETIRAPRRSEEHQR